MQERPAKSRDEIASSHDDDARGGNGTDYGTGLFFLCRDVSEN